MHLILRRGSVLGDPFRGVSGLQTAGMGRGREGGEDVHWAERLSGRFPSATRDYLPQGPGTVLGGRCQRERKWQSVGISKAEAGTAEQDLASESAGSHLVF